jgi:hypothetical protein
MRRKKSERAKEKRLSLLRFYCGILAPILATLTTKEYEAWYAYIPTPLPSAYCQRLSSSP